MFLSDLSLLERKPNANSGHDSAKVRLFSTAQPVDTASYSDPLSKRQGLAVIEEQRARNMAPIRFVSHLMFGDASHTRSASSISQSALASTAIRNGSCCSAPCAPSAPRARLAEKRRVGAGRPIAGSTNVTAYRKRETTEQECKRCGSATPV